MNEPPLPGDVVERFRELAGRAQSSLREPTAVVLSTADAQGRPSGRNVLLKSVDERGFVFYSNLGSRKARHLAENPEAALTFFWQALMRQVQVEGRVEPVDDATADAYWASRPRGSQIGALASRQSETLDKRETLEGRVAELEREYEGQEIPRPPFWSGFLLRPRRIEFWESRMDRLHDRFLYEVKDGDWTLRLLHP